MEIKLDNNYTVLSDKYCFILHYSNTYINDEGKEVLSTNESFHNSLKQCLLKYCNQVLKHEDSIDSLLKKLSELEQSIKQLKI